jgi:hypothetical protein
LIGLNCIESAWFQRQDGINWSFNISFAFKFNLHHYKQAMAFQERAESRNAAAVQTAARLAAAAQRSASQNQAWRCKLKRVELC